MKRKQEKGSKEIKSQTKTAFDQIPQKPMSI